MEEPQEDDLLRERAFQRAGGLDLSGFALNVEPEAAHEEDAEESTARGRRCYGRHPVSVWTHF